MKASTRMDPIVASVPSHADKCIAGSQSAVSKVAISGIIEIHQIPTSIEADMNS
jgi:hypothetical protein